jgi:adenylosuccinate synthase
MHRCGIRAADLADPELLKVKIASALEEKNVLFKHLYGAESMDPEAVFQQLLPVAERVVPYLADVSTDIQKAVAAGGSVLFEGAQGTHWTSTMARTPSSPRPHGFGQRGSVRAARPNARRIIAIVKAYTTRVGGGPFPTELFDATGDYLQDKGGEFGATTGRKRRCGWLDMVVLRESARLNGPRSLP